MANSRAVSNTFMDRTSSISHHFHAIRHTRNGKTGSYLNPQPRRRAPAQRNRLPRGPRDGKPGPSERHILIFSLLHRQRRRCSNTSVHLQTPTPTTSLPTTTSKAHTSLPHSLRRTIMAPQNIPRIPLHPLPPDPPLRPRLLRLRSRLAILANLFLHHLPPHLHRRSRNPLLHNKHPRHLVQFCCLAPRAPSRALENNDIHASPICDIPRFDSLAESRGRGNLDGDGVFESEGLYAEYGSSA